MARGAVLLLGVAVVFLIVSATSHAVRDSGDAAPDRARLRHDGWSFPDTLPHGMRLMSVEERGPDGTLVTAAAAPGDGDDYVHLGYTNGSSVVSVFIQRGRLDARQLLNWHVKELNGHTIWVQGSSGTNAIWPSGDYVYTVLADAPADVVDGVVAALPHEGEPGLWQRLARGMDRVLAWADPFD